MNERDFEVAVSVKDGEYGLYVSGDTANAVKGLLLAVASIIEKTKDENVSNAEIEIAMLTEFKVAMEFIRENIEEEDVIAEFE